jgi:hypothetical protein
VFGLVIGLTEHLHIVTSSNSMAIANSHTIMFITASTKTSQTAVFTCCLVTVSNAVASSASVFTSLQAGDFLTYNSALLRNELQQWEAPPPPTPPPEVTLTTASGSDSSVCLPAFRLSLDSLLGLTGLCFNSPHISSARTHRVHRFPQFLYCRVTSLQTRTWLVPLLRLSVAVMACFCCNSDVICGYDWMCWKSKPGPPTWAGFSLTRC